MSIYVKNGNMQKKIGEIYNKKSGVQKKIKYGYKKVDGQWRMFYNLSGLRATKIYPIAFDNADQVYTGGYSVYHESGYTALSVFDNNLSLKYTNDSLQVTGKFTQNGEAYLHVNYASINGVLYGLGIVIEFDADLKAGDVLKSPKVRKFERDTIGYNPFYCKEIGLFLCPDDFSNEHFDSDYYGITFKKDYKGKIYYVFSDAVSSMKKNGGMDNYSDAYNQYYLSGITETLTLDWTRVTLNKERVSLSGAEIGNSYPANSSYTDSDLPDAGIPDLNIDMRDRC